MAYVRLAFRALACFVPGIVDELSTLPTTYRTFHKLREPETHRLTKIFRHFQQTFRHVAGTSRNLPTLWVLHFDPVRPPESAGRVFRNDVAARKTPRRVLYAGQLIAGPRGIDSKWELLILEIKEPPAIIPFQGDLSPSQRHLRIRIEGSDIGPGGW